MRKRNLKRTKRNRETEDKLVSMSEIRPLLSKEQRSKAECEFEISEWKTYLAASFMHMHPGDGNSTQPHAARSVLVPCFIFHTKS